MLNMSASTDKQPWYRHPWVWLLIAVPLAAVIGGIITIYLAVTTSDGLVVDDYYRQGKAINRILARDRAAAEHGLEAHIALDAANNRVTVQLAARDADMPDALTLAFLHPTTQGLLCLGRPSFVPATPRGIIELLRRYQIPTGGRRAVVLWFLVLAAGCGAVTVAVAMEAHASTAASAIRWSAPEPTTCS